MWGMWARVYVQTDIPESFVFEYTLQITEHLDALYLQLSKGGRASTLFFFFFFFFFINLFLFIIFGCVGSSLLRVGFL